MKKFLFLWCSVFFVLVSSFLLSANGEQPKGSVFTIDENGYIQFVNEATVRICGTDITTQTNEDGEYTFTSPQFYADKYILKVTKSNLINYVPTYTGLTPINLVGEFNSLNSILILPSSYTPSSGKSHLIVITYSIQEEGFVYGASARVYNSNNQRVDNQSGITVKYLKVSETEGEEPKLEFVDNPGDQTIGYILMNINPGFYSISASKDGVDFIHRPVMTFADSVTSCIHVLDGVWSALDLMDFEGILKDETGNPVNQATVRTVGPNYSDTTDANGEFSLNNLPYPSIFFFKSSKTGYKDTYKVELVIEEIEPEIEPLQNGNNSKQFFILSDSAFNKVVDDLGIIPDSNKGHYVGNIYDYYGNPIKNVYVEIVDENGESVQGIDVYFMDSNGKNFDPDLESTTDSGIFLIPNLDPEKVYYLKFILNNQVIAVDLINVFQNGITMSLLRCFNISKGNLILSDPGQDLNPIIIDKNATDVEVLKFRLNENTGYEDVQLEVDTIIIRDIGTGDMSKISSAKLVVGAGEYNGIINTTKRTIEFHPFIEISKGEYVDFSVFYTFNNAVSGSNYKACLLNNGDINGWGEVTGLNVSIKGAPVYGKLVVIETTGAPNIAVDPNHIDFGLVKVGETTDLSRIMVINAGDQNLIIGEVTTTGNINDFIVDVSNISGKTLTPTSYNYIYVQFRPKSNGTKTLTITIPSNDPDENPYIITLTGEGYGAETGGGGCFIATACFGDYNHPIVKILRNFRDKYLLKNRIGKAFVKWYYSHSPKYAEIIKNNGILKFAVRICLYPVSLVIWLILKGLLVPLVFILSFGILLRQFK